MFTTVIVPADLAVNLSRPDWKVFDCRFDLFDTEAGARQYRESHIAGAVYAHLDRDLSGPPVSDHGRHPLPSPDALVKLFSRLGIGSADQVVVYDDMHGAMAGRLWWMLRYMGHASAAVLDGGWPAWCRAGGPRSSTFEQPCDQPFYGRAQGDRLVTLAQFDAYEQLIDAREPARYTGAIEPIDARAGHIPGARNHFWRKNLAGDGSFLSPEALAESWRISLNGQDPGADTVHYCGSGVSSCHNVLAQVLAGFPMPRLYVGSWSEWCSDKARPVATGSARGLTDENM